jgi:hypothetical protein
VENRQALHYGRWRLEKQITVEIENRSYEGIKKRGGGGPHISKLERTEVCFQKISL